MKHPLPLVLRTVMDGRLTMRQAHGLWAYAVYGVTPADDAESQTAVLINCRRDLPPWLFSGPPNHPDNAWIDFQAFMGLAAMHHVALGICLKCRHGRRLQPGSRGIPPPPISAALP